MSAAADAVAADAATYVAIVALGHAVMWLVTDMTLTENQALNSQ